MHTENEALLVLNAIDGLTNARIRKLIEYFGSAAQVLKLPQNTLQESQILPEAAINNILNFPKDKFLQNEYNLITNNNIIIKYYNDSDYPGQLKEIPDAPVVLYIKGEIPKESNLSLAIVGSRKASYYGLSIAEKFASRLAEYGIVVVSGLALGIDAAAHQGVLKSHAKTIAVLGCGLNIPYPKQNQRLFDEIAESGAVISEFSMQTLPHPFNFPRRNRIISGLSLGVIVIEAALKSGALISARFALEQGREVYAVPGRIDSLQSMGVNYLIKQGAKLVTCVEDVLEDLKDLIPFYIQGSENLETKEINKDLSGLSEEEKQMYKLITNQPMDIDQIHQVSQINVSAAVSVLFQLELKKLIKQLPGKRFIKI